MIKLSDRLQLMADEIKPGDSVLDVGTDHGYLPIYLFENKISNKIILSDISKASLSKAKENIEKYCPDSNLEPRFGDGIKVLDNGEVDNVVIAGMGGLLISDILGFDLDKSHSIKKFILQPRNHVGDLRKFLILNGFDIVKESLVREGRFICEILVAIPSKFVFKEQEFVDGKIEWEVPKTLLKFKSELLDEYLLRKINTEKKILFQLSESSENNAKIEICKKRISYLKNLREEAHEI